MQILLFASSDERAIDAALEAKPDILVVAPSGCGLARDRARGHPASPRLWVLIGPLDQGRADAEIAAALAARPDALCLAGAVGRRDVEQLGAKLAVAEVEHSLPDGCTRIVALTSRAASVAALPTFGPGGAGRLAGFVLDFDGLRSDLACGPDAAVLALALGTFILAARIADVPAIFRLDQGGDVEMTDRLEVVRSEGFTAVLVDQPEAVAAIRVAFRPGSVS